MGKLLMGGLYMAPYTIERELIQIIIDNENRTHEEPGQSLEIDNLSNRIDCNFGLIEEEIETSSIYVRHDCSRGT